MTHTIGIMLGRLSGPRDGRIQSFPVETWRDEFLRARDAGMDCLEWIYEEATEFLNPLRTDEGLTDLLHLQRASSVPLSSICADYFMTHRLVTREGRVDQDASARLTWLLSRAARAGARYVVLPFVDASSLRTAREVDGAAEVLRQAAPIAAACGLELHLETDLEPAIFYRLLEGLNHPAVRVTYDIGNSAALGHAPDEEFAAIGAWLGSVHVKDRMLSGGTVPLGTGAVDFPVCFEAIHRIEFHGPFILQAARDPATSEIELARKNRRFVERLLAATATQGEPDRGPGAG